MILLLHVNLKLLLILELFQLGKDKTGCCTFNTVFIKDNNSVAVSSGGGNNKCITLIDIESQEVMTTISMDISIYGIITTCHGICVIVCVVKFVSICCHVKNS
jgi:hypothetical protein